MIVTFEWKVQICRNMPVQKQMFIWGNVISGCYSRSPGRLVFFILFYFLVEAYKTMGYSSHPRMTFCSVPMKWKMYFFNWRHGQNYILVSIFNIAKIEAQCLWLEQEFLICCWQSWHYLALYVIGQESWSNVSCKNVLMFPMKSQALLCSFFLAVLILTMNPMCIKFKYKFTTALFFILAFKILLCCH